MRAAGRLVLGIARFGWRNARVYGGGWGLGMAIAPRPVGRWVPGDLHTCSVLNRAEARKRAFCPLLGYDFRDLHTRGPGWPRR
jgi:hypothetical protein